MNSVVGHFNYIIILLFLTGAGLLLFDAKQYDKAQMKKEKKVSKFLGLVNLALGLALWGGFKLFGG